MNLQNELDNLRRYYDGRAPEYEALYYRPDTDRSTELERAGEDMLSLVRERRVLEIACGTGYWTERIARVARSVVATDVSDDMLALARDRGLSGDVVRLLRADAYRLHLIPGDFDAGVANFWLSHVPTSRMTEFLERWHERLGRTSVVFMIDNLYVPGQGGLLVRRAGATDTFKRRELANRSVHEIIKNYYEIPELEALLSRYARELHFGTGKYYWWVSYEIA